MATTGENTLRSHGISMETTRNSHDVLPTEIQLSTVLKVKQLIMIKGLSKLLIIGQFTFIVFLRSVQVSSIATLLKKAVCNLSSPQNIHLLHIRGVRKGQQWPDVCLNVAKETSGLSQMNSFYLGSFRTRY